RRSDPTHTLCHKLTNAPQRALRSVGIASPANGNPPNVASALHRHTKNACAGCRHRFLPLSGIVIVRNFRGALCAWAASWPPSRGGVMGHPAEVAVRGRSKLRAHSAVEVLGRGLALTALITKRRGCASEDRAGSLDRRLAILLAGMAAVASMMAEPALGIFINDKFDPNAPPVLAASNEFPN